jgi:hypothetical protein
MDASFEEFGLDPEDVEMQLNLMLIDSDSTDSDSSNPTAQQVLAPVHQVQVPEVNPVLTGAVEVEQDTAIPSFWREQRYNLLAGIVLLVAGTVLSVYLVPEMEKWK